MKVSVIGLGYIGLPAAALISGKGIPVHGVDINEKIVSTINSGKIHFIEPDLEGLIHNAVTKKLLVADTKPAEADVFVISVPTPILSDYNPDLNYVETAVRSVIPYLQKGNLLIIESTCPVGTTEQMAEMIFNQRPDLKEHLHIAYCPERVLPGNIIHELTSNDRVIGGLDEASTAAAADFYRQFVNGSMHLTNVRTAEMCKLVENASRDVSIAFANELSMICEKANIDANELIQLANKHPRVNILKPGPGVGGHCIAIDPWFIVSGYREQSKLIEQARKVNLNKTEWVIEKIISQAKALEATLNRKPIIAALGLTYKADVDDIRESPALEIVHALRRNHYEVVSVEPHAQNGLQQQIEAVSLEHAIEKADLVVFLVAHKHFRSLRVPEGKTVLDFCGITNGLHI
jgi:UDP-N-acetyl-D-mannosaminuronic acid dehydrogenase